MIKLITGEKGTGKTKVLIDMIKESLATASGDIVCIEKGLKLTYDIPHKVRLVAAEEYDINSYDSFYGFVAGMLAGNYDIQEIFVDGILKIGGRDYNELASFLEQIYELSSVNEKDFVFTISADKEELPESIFNYCKVI